MASHLVSRRALAFDDFELDLETEQLRKAGEVVRLQPQPFKVLALLVSRAGQVVTREELRRELWGDQTFVDFEQGLNYCVRQIRVGLGDDIQTPRYIKTIPRHGYRFIAQVKGLEAPPTSSDSSPAAAKASPIRPRRILIGTASAALLALLIAAVVLLHFRRPPLLSAKDSLLVTEFANNTGDPVFDGTLRKAVAVDLGQSPYLRILSDDHVRQSLRFMGKSPSIRLTPEIGSEICRRDGIKAMLAGSITTLGKQYVLNLEAIDANSGDILAQEQAPASSKEQVLGALGQCTERMRRKLGESLASVQHFNKPLEQATTSSVEALQLYTLGLEKRELDGELASMPFFQQAVQLDPNFALAWAHLGVAYGNIEQWNLAEEYEKKALALSDRISERERLYITAHYYNIIGQKEKEIQAYDLYSQLYPRDALPQGNLAMDYNVLGRFDKALEHGLAGLRLAPSNLNTRCEIARAYAALGRLTEAKTTMQEGLHYSPDHWRLYLELSNIALAQGDDGGRRRADAALRESPEGTLFLLSRDAALAASVGRLRNAQQLYSLANRLALKLKLKENASYSLALQAVYEAYLQHPSAARTSAKAALQMSQMFDTTVAAAFALASAGDDRQAREVIQDLAKHRPEDTFIQFIWVPTIEALISLHHGDADRAIQILGPAAQYDRATLDAVLVRANAYLQAKRAPEAVEEYRKILALRERFPFDPACSLAQLGLARAYSLASDITRSRATYEDFLALWKDADPDISVLRQAKSEYAKLQ